LPLEGLTELHDRIMAEVPGISRIALDITSKPPATTEWE
jgi:GMP synthase (glutamine-hydrolysing)